MAGFGGAVKLTGESEYRKALKNITQNLKEVSSEMKLVSAQYSNNDKSTEALTAKSEVLNKKLEQQKEKVSVLKNQYSEMAKQYDTNKTKNDALAKKYDEEKQKLKTLETSLGATSDEYKDQAKLVSDLESELQKSTKAQDANATTMSNLRIQLNGANADVARTTKEIEGLAQEMEQGAKASDNLGDGIEEASESADGASEGFTVMKGALADLVADGIRATIGALKDLVVESSNAYAQFSANTGVATDAMDGYKKAIDNVYKSNFGESLEEVADAMARVKEVTGELDPSKLESMTEKAMTLEDVFGMDMTETLRGVQSLINHFGISSNEAFDIMAQGAQNGLNYTDELGDNISEYAGKFAEAGYTTEEYFQLLENGANGGAYNLDKVNDAINEVTARLADGTIGDSLDIYSKGTRELFRAWQDGEATQKQVIDSIVADIQRTTNEQEKMNMSAKAFGTMAEDGGTQFIEALTSVGNSYDNVQGKADKLANTKYDTPISALQGLGRTLQTDLLQPLVSAIMPAINDGVQVLTDGLHWLLNNGEKVSAVIAGIAVAVGSYVAYTTALTVMKDGWQALTIVTKAQTLAQTALNAVMSANPIGVVIALIAGLVTAFVVLWNKSEGFREFWIGLWETIKSVAEPIIDGLVNALTGAWDAIKSVWSTAVDFFNKLWNAIKIIFAPVVDFYGTLFGNAWTLVKDIWLVAKYFFNELWESIKKVFEPVVDFFKGVFSGAWNAVKSVWDFVVNYYTTLWNGIKAIFTPVVEFFGGIFSKAWTAIKNVFNPVGQFFGNIWNTIKSKFTNIGQKVGESIGSAFKKAINAVLATAERVLNAPINAINGLIGKIASFTGITLGTLNTFNLPRLAKGGVVRGATLAEIGEDGAEAVVPLENNTGWLTRVAEILAKSLITSLASISENINSTNYDENGYNSTVEAFKDALGQMKVVLDDEEVGNFVEKTVADAIYT